MTILAIDTSNEALGIALSQEHEVIAEFVSVSKKKHSKRLMPAIVQLMKNADIKPEDLSKIIVAKGPGSYTGVRIGLSIAKTMAWSLKIPIVGISSLETLSLQAQGRNALVSPFFDARRGLIYTGLYDADGEVVMPDQNVLMEDWLDQLSKLDKKVLFISPDLQIFKSQISDTLGDKALFLPKGFHTTRPGLLALTGRDRESEPVHQLVPSYLRMVEAEANWLAEQKEIKNE